MSSTAPDPAPKARTPGADAPALPAPPAGLPETILPGIRRILAPNPSPMTYWGTNTFLIGEGEVSVIDPGPALPDHMTAILTSLAPGERIVHIFVTHAHIDHSPLARPLAEATGAKVFAFGPPEAGRSPVMEALAAQGLAGGGEGVDRDFAPDICLADGEALDIGNGAALTALWTPGHFSSHLSFALGDVVFTGDHVMGWASTMISPPDGDLTAFLASLDKLAARKDRLFLPAHGGPVEDPAARLAWLAAHRRGRERQILAALATGPATIPELTRRIYTDVNPRLLPAAERNVFAHLIDLHNRQIVRARPALSPGAEFDRSS